jgi:2'-5' RNA ligase
LRLFAAVWPPASLVHELERLPRPAVAGVRWTTPDQWHVTLRFFGSVADPAEAEAALARFSLSEHATAVAGPAVVRLSKAVLCLPVHGLEALAAAVARVSSEVGEPPEDRPFRGHLTLARARRGADLRPLAGAHLEATWPIEEATLVSSRTHPQGARYTVLARYRLGP